MKEGRRPLWEDDVNKEGGTWRFKCHKKYTVSINFSSFICYYFLILYSIFIYVMSLKQYNLLKTSLLAILL